MGPDAAVEELGIPEGVRDVVGRRLSRLPSRPTGSWRCRGGRAGVRAGRASSDAGGLGEDELLAALEEAAARPPARRGARRPLPLRPRPGAGHALRGAHRGATGGPPPAGGRSHRIPPRPALDDHLPALAHHWARASAPAAETARAVDYAARAGDRALAQLAHDEAVVYYRQALELLDVAGAARRRPSASSSCISLGEAQRRAGDPAHRETLLDAARAGRAAGDADALARAALANTRGMFSIMAGRFDAERVDVLEAALAVAGVARHSRPGPPPRHPRRRAHLRRGQGSTGTSRYRMKP